MKTRGKIRQYIYVITLFFITLSGFGQMPIFKRYYIADLPGLAWLARFYVTHIIHYIAAIVLLALVAYIICDFILKGLKFQKITGPGYFKAVILTILVCSGSLMVIKNLPDMYFPHTAIIALDLIHLGACMMLLITSFDALIRKKD